MFSVPLDVNYVNWVVAVCISYLSIMNFTRLRMCLS